MSRTCPTCAAPVADGVGTCPRDGTPVPLAHNPFLPTPARSQAGEAGTGVEATVVAQLEDASEPVLEPTLIRRSDKLGPPGGPVVEQTVVRRSDKFPVVGDGTGARAMRRSGGPAMFADQSAAGGAGDPGGTAPGLAAVADPLIGQQVGEYVIRARIGEGGMGEVYQGEHPMIGKRVGIKVLRQGVASNPDEAARLLTEARTANAIGHRGIIDIFGFGTLPDGRQYVVMEYLVGRPLASFIHDRAPLVPADALQVLDEILSPLAAAHGAGVIHRDLKPSNIFLVDQPDGTMFVKILDFGLAKKAALSHGETPQTRVSRIIGTPEYMAPEQARGESVSPRTDLYALGVIAYELVTGVLPFVAPTAWETVTLQMTQAPRPPSEVVSDVPRPLETLVLSLLAKVPSERPESAEQVRAEIKRLRKSLRLDVTRLMAALPEKTDPDAPQPARAKATPALLGPVPRTDAAGDASPRPAPSARPSGPRRTRSADSSRAVRVTTDPGADGVHATSADLPGTRRGTSPLAIAGGVAVAVALLVATVAGLSLLKERGPLEAGRATTTPLGAPPSRPVVVPPASTASPVGSETPPGTPPGALPTVAGPEELRPSSPTLVVAPAADLVTPVVEKPPRRRELPRRDEVGVALKGTRRQELLLKLDELDRRQREKCRNPFIQDTLAALRAKQAQLTNVQLRQQLQDISDTVNACR